MSDGVALPDAATLGALATRFAVPGAALSVATDRATETVCAGFADLAAGRAVTPATRFEIGSITKLATVLAVLRLADQGLLSPDLTVAEAVPEFADGAGADRIVLRQLMSHTAGLDGDLFTDTEDGPAVLADFARALAALPPLLAPGAAFSYCNGGFALLARAAERAARAPWPDVLAACVQRPLGLGNADFWPAPDAAQAVGHETGPDGAPRAVPAARRPRAMAPAGNGPLASAADLARLGLALCDPGALVGRFGNAMLAPAIRFHPRVTGFQAWGLRCFDDGAVFGHDGATPGQAGFLRLLPKRRLAVALLTNGGDARGLFAALWTALGLPLVPVFAPGSDADPHPAAANGLYACADHEVSLQGMAVRLPDGARVPLLPRGGGAYGAHLRGSAVETPHYFLPPGAGGRPTHFVFRMRALRRAEPRRVP